MDVKSMTTEALQQLCRQDAENPNNGMSWDELEPILTELELRQQERSPGAKTAETAWRELQEIYLSKDLASAGKDCLKNRRNDHDREGVASQNRLESE